MATFFTSFTGVHWKTAPRTQQYRRQSLRKGPAQIKKLHCFPRQKQKLAWRKSWDLTDREHKELVLEARGIKASNRSDLPNGKLMNLRMAVSRRSV